MTVYAMNKKQKEMHDLLDHWLEVHSSTKAELRTLLKDQHVEYQIVPKQENACPIKVAVSNAGGYVVLIGDRLQYESDDGYEDSFILQILDAVTAGKVRETLWYRNGEIVKSHGVVEIYPTPFERKRYRLSALLLRAQEKKEKRYVPY